ncbi:hypothetical protein GUITHDRAFT_101788 [Guillardia theta CCMP2712]|uniref:Uncharacterized protein n=1 Tax=Guillardia theta (strain CCMP2712) TaxID=905079 RepID=L1JWZ4_GUITC|nr:hypothetical protein GUITHDRAFT_101788 [Guillardia theta CCMP2712]EKX52628.1 hypothetical protein GUITHDRAFT_101788 [Guillardia theta CCMP2712]|eukprot:XP_005839608.1 hypothetical protein GUITHDRAFT_101788 [Guillardia theta CCMP2712]
MLEHRRKKLEILTSRTSQQSQQVTAERRALTDRPGEAGRYYPALNLQEESIKSRHVSKMLPKLRHKMQEKNEKLKYVQALKNDTRVVVSLQERVQLKRKIKLWLSFLFFYKSLQRLKVYWNDAKGLNEMKYVRFRAATRIQRAVLHVQAKKSMISWMHKLVAFNRSSWKFRLALRIHRKRRATRIITDFLHKCASFEKATEESRIIRTKVLHFFNKVKRCQQLFRDYCAVQRARFEVMERQWSMFVANPRLNWVLRAPPPDSPFDPSRNSFSDLLPSHILESLDNLNPFQRTQSQLPSNLVNAEIAKKAAKYLKAANGFLLDSMETDGFVQDVLKMLRLKLKAEMETIENLPRGATRFDVLLAHPAVTHFVQNKIHFRLRKIQSLPDIEVEVESSPRRKSSVFQVEKGDKGYVSVSMEEEKEEKKNRFSSLIAAITPRKEREELESFTKDALMKVQRLCERNLSLPLDLYMM